MYESWRLPVQVARAVAQPAAWRRSRWRSLTPAAWASLHCSSGCSSAAAMRAGQMRSRRAHSRTQVSSELSGAPVSQKLHRKRVTAAAAAGHMTGITARRRTHVGATSMDCFLDPDAKLPGELLTVPVSSCAPLVSGHVTLCGLCCGCGADAGPSHEPWP